MLVCCTGIEDCKGAMNDQMVRTNRERMPARTVRVRIYGGDSATNRVLSLDVWLFALNQERMDAWWDDGQLDGEASPNASRGVHTVA